MSPRRCSAKISSQDDSQAHWLHDSEQVLTATLRQLERALAGQRQESQDIIADITRSNAVMASKQWPLSQ